MAFNMCLKRKSINLSKNIKYLINRKSPSDVDDEFSGSRMKNKGLNRAELLDWKKEQKLKKINKKLEYIYLLLCSLYNLKTR